MLRFILKRRHAATRNALRHLMARPRDLASAILVPTILFVFLVSRALALVRDQRSAIIEHLELIEVGLVATTGAAVVILAAGTFEHELARARASWLSLLPFSPGALAFRAGLVASERATLAWLATAAGACVLARGLDRSITSVLPVLAGTMVLASLALGLAISSTAWRLGRSLPAIGPSALRVRAEQIALIVITSTIASTVAPYALDAARGGFGGAVAALSIVAVGAGLILLGLRRMQSHARHIDIRLEYRLRAPRLQELPAQIERLLAIVDRQRVRHLGTFQLKARGQQGFSLFHSQLPTLLLFLLISVIGFRVAIEADSGLVFGLIAGGASTLILLPLVHSLSSLYRLLRPLPVSFASAVWSVARLPAYLTAAIAIIILMISFFGRVPATASYIGLVTFVVGTWTLAAFVFPASPFAAGVAVAVIWTILGALIAAIPLGAPIAALLLAIALIRAGRSSWKLRDVV